MNRNLWNLIRAIIVVKHETRDRSNFDGSNGGWVVWFQPISFTVICPLSKELSHEKRVVISFLRI